MNEKLLKPMGFLAALLAAMALAWTLGLPSGRAEPGEGAQEPEKPPLWTRPLIRNDQLSLTMRAEAEFEYDSNVFRYSRDDIDDYDAGLNRSTKFEHADSIDDLISTLAVGFDLTQKILAGRPTTFRQRSKFDLYAKNSIKDFETYSFEVKQGITRNDIAKARYVYLPGYFVRNLFDPDASAYRKAAFDRNSFTLSYWKRLMQRLRIRLLYQYADKDYGDDFNERDNRDHRLNVTLIQSKVLPSLKIVPFYEFVRSDADGTDADAAVDDDISHTQHGMGVRMSLTLLDRIRIKPFYRMDFKAYTTGHTAVEDPLHASREDQIFSVGLEAEYEPIRDLRLFARYEFTESNPETSADPSSTSRDDVLGYSTHLIRLRCLFRF